MADVAAIRAALATQLTAQTGTRTFAEAPGQVPIPAIVIIPGSPAVVYGRTMDGECTVNLRAVILVSEASDRAGQDALDPYLSTSSAQSVPAAVQADPTLGAVVEYAVVLNVSRYGILEYAGQPFLGATFEIETGAHL